MTTIDYELSEECVTAIYDFTLKKLLSDPQVAPLLALGRSLVRNSPNGAALKRKQLYSPEPENEAKRLKSDEALALDVISDIFRDLFERVKGVKEVAETPEPPNDPWPEKCAWETHNFTTDILKAMMDAETAEATIVMKAVAWMDALKGENSSAIRDKFFQGRTAFLPDEDKNDLKVAILFSKIVDEIDKSISHETGRSTIKQWYRYHRLFELVDWKILSILAFSPTFRQYAVTANDANWNELHDQLGSRVNEIELVGSFHCSEWYDVLQVAVGLDERTLEFSEYSGHYHQWSVSSDGGVISKIEPTFEVLESDVFGRGTKYQYDPRYIRAKMPDVEPCTLCRKKFCECPTHIWFPMRVIIVDFGSRGRGIRALQNAESGQILGEYIGEIIEENINLYHEDAYPLSGHREDNKPSAYKTTNKMRGNWTRFANHRCQGANAAIDHIFWRGKMLSVFRAVEDIKIFDEITIDYGKGYWKNNKKKCLCPSKTHYGQ